MGNLPYNRGEHKNIWNHLGKQRESEPFQPYSAGRVAIGPTWKVTLWGFDFWRVGGLSLHFLVGDFNPFEKILVKLDHFLR